MKEQAIRGEGEWEPIQISWPKNWPLSPTIHKALLKAQNHKPKSYKPTGDWITPTHSNKTFERYKKQHSRERFREKQIAIETQLCVAKLAWPVFLHKPVWPVSETGLAGFYAQQPETISKKRWFLLKLSFVQSFLKELWNYSQKLNSKNFMNQSRSKKPSPRMGFSQFSSKT